MFVAAASSGATSDALPSFDAEYIAALKGAKVLPLRTERCDISVL
jgi:hypothetical protein